jgi:iron complex transport system substrate-binding protein
MINKIRLSAFLVVFVITASFAWASSRVTYPLNVKDEFGNTLRITAQPARIVSCMPSITEMLFALNLDNEVVGVTTNCNHPRGALQKEKVGRETMNLEKIVSLNPDLVVMLASAQKTDIERLKKNKLPVYVINPNSINGIINSLRKLGVACNRQNSASRIIQWMNRKLLWVEAKIEEENAVKPKAMVVVGNNPLVVAGPNSFIGDIVRRAGCLNIVSSNIHYPTYSFEALIKQNPDVIVVSKTVVKDEKDIYNDKRWKNLKAVKENRVLFIDSDIISRPGPRAVLAVEQIAGFAYNWSK